MFKPFIISISTLLIMAGVAHARIIDTSSRTMVDEREALSRIIDKYNQHVAFYAPQIHGASDQLTFNELVMSFSQAIQNDLGLCLQGPLTRQADRLMHVIDQSRLSLKFERVFVTLNPNDYEEEIGLSLSILPNPPNDSIFTLFINIHNCQG